MLVWCSTLFSLFQLREIVGSDPHTSVFPAYGYSQTYHVWKVSCWSSKWVCAAHTTSVGHLLLLFVQVWWSWWHSLRAVVLIREQTRLIYAWLTDVDSQQIHSQGPKSQHFPRGHAPTPLTSACFACSVLDYHQNFLLLCTDNLLFHSLCIIA